MCQTLIFVCGTFNVSFRRNDKSQSGEPRAGLTDKRELSHLYVAIFAVLRFSVSLDFVRAVSSMLPAHSSILTVGRVTNIKGCMPPLHGNATILLLL